MKKKNNCIFSVYLSLFFLISCSDENSGIEVENYEIYYFDSTQTGELNEADRAQLVDQINSQSHPHNYSICNDINRDGKVDNKDLEVFDEMKKNGTMKKCKLDFSFMHARQVPPDDSCTDIQKECGIPEISDVDFMRLHPYPRHVIENINPQALSTIEKFSYVYCGGYIEVHGNKNTNVKVFGNRYLFNIPEEGQVGIKIKPTILYYDFYFSKPEYSSSLIHRVSERSKLYPKLSLYLFGSLGGQLLRAFTNDPEGWSKYENEFFVSLPFHKSVSNIYRESSQSYILKNHNVYRARAMNILNPAQYPDDHIRLNSNAFMQLWTDDNSIKIYIGQHRLFSRIEINPDLSDLDI